MANRANIFKKVFLLLLCAFIYSQSADATKFEAGNEWGWGVTTQKETKVVPYFDQAIGNHLLQKDLKALANTDVIRESYARSINVYRTAFGRLSEFGWSNPDFYEKIYAYLASSEWDKDLKKLSAGDAAFVRIIVYYCFLDLSSFKDQSIRFVQLQLDKITNEDQRTFLEEFFYIKPQQETLHKSHGIFFMGFGGEFFSNGANEKLNPGPIFDIGFGYCLFGSYCAEFRIGGILFTDPYKEDVVQSGITYSKNDISYTAVETLLRAKLYYSYDYEIAVYGGFKLHAIELPEDDDKSYKEKFGKGMANAYSYSYTAGITGARYFGGGSVSPGIFGIELRAGMANFGDNKFDISGLNWYGNVDLVFKLF